MTNFSDMRLEGIQTVVAALPADEFAHFREWVTELQEARFDKTIERDVVAGKLDWLAETAMADYEASRSRKFGSTPIVLIFPNADAAGGGTGRVVSLVPHPCSRYRQHRPGR